METQQTVTENQHSAHLRVEAVEWKTSVEGINEYRLANGLRVVLMPEPSTQTITVNITYLVGSRHENYGETGMAHLLEHLLFKGTPKHPNIPQELTEHGTNSNATTWYDRTNYFETFAATDENLEWALELEADRMINSFVAKKDLDSEMTVVRNEMERDENNIGRILMQRVTAAAFEWHNYGKPTIGARSDVENVPIERLQAFYKKYYQPNNAVLTVAGQIDETKTLELIKKYFGPLSPATEEFPTIYTIEPVQDGERAVTLRRVGDLQMIDAAYHVPDGAHPDFAALSILSEILTNIPAGRLNKALVETKMASSVGGAAIQLKDPGLAIFSATLKKDDSIEAAQTVFLETLEGFNKQPVTAEDVERARTKLLSNIELKLSSSNQLALELNEWVAKGDWRLYFLNRDRLREVTKEDVERVAAKYLVSSNRTLGLFIPTEKPLRADVPRTTEAEFAAMLENYRGDEVTQTGEAFDPSPANIDSLTKRLNLPGGLKIALLPKKTRGKTVELKLSLRFGSEEILMNRRPASDLVGQMLLRGTVNKTRQQIRDEFDKNKAVINISSSATGANFWIKTTRTGLADVLKLVTEVLRQPSFPAEEFEQLKREVLTLIESQKSEPEKIAATTFHRHLKPYSKGHPFQIFELDEEIERIKNTTVEDVKKFYSDFYGASNAQLAAVGDFDEVEVSELAAELLGDWQNPVSYSRVQQIYFEAEPVNQALETPDKANAYFYAGLNLKLRDDNPDYPALLLSNFMLGGGFLSGRLAVRIRQQEGLSYTVNSFLSESSLDESGFFQVFAISAPQNVAKLETAFEEEIARVLNDGFTEDEVAGAKSGFLQSRAVNRMQDKMLAETLAGYLFLDRNFEWDADLERRISNLSTQEINDAIRRHFRPEKISIIKAGDFRTAVAALEPIS